MKRSWVGSLLLGFGTALVVGVLAAGASETMFGGVVYTWPTSHGVAGKLLVTDGAKTLSWTGTPGTAPVPANIVMFVAGPCPTGWAHYAAADGRYIVGTPAAGTNELTVGTALAAGENRATGTHTHTHTESLSVSVTAHSHSVTDPSHAHGAEDDWGSALTYQGNAGVYAGKLGSGSGYNHQTDNATTGVTLSDTDTNVSVTSAGVTVGNGGSSVAGTNAPYIQLRACKKA